MQGGEELSIEELFSNLSTYKEQLQQVLYCLCSYSFSFVGELKILILIFLTQFCKFCNGYLKICGLGLGFSSSIETELN